MQNWIPSAEVLQWPDASICHVVVVALAAALVAAAGVASAVLLPERAAAWELRTGHVQADIDGVGLEVYTYRPTKCAAPSLLLLFHGNGRDAEFYRDAARELADSACFVIYAPLFDKDRFPNWSYHRGGVVRNGDLLQQEDWTVRMVRGLIDWARGQEGQSHAPVFLFGHSAGGQFLSRVAAYALPEDVERIVIANPSTYVMPNSEEKAPYGFGGLPDKMASQCLQDYLAAPLTVFLGTEDTGVEDLTDTPEAMRQGRNRLERGQHVFELAREAAEVRGWSFNWRLVYAKDVDHTAPGMLNADERLEAFGSTKPRTTTE